MNRCGGAKQRNKGRRIVIILITFENACVSVFEI
jgi:hypothetical protein